MRNRGPATTGGVRTLATEHVPVTPPRVQERSKAGCGPGRLRASETGFYRKEFILKLQA